MRHESAIPAAVGLAVAWGGTALLVSPVFSFLISPIALRVKISSPILTNLLGQAALWLLCAIVIAVVLRWEKQPLASLWLKPPQWQCLFWAAVLIAAHLAIIFPATELIRNRIGLQGYAGGVETVLALPLRVRILAVLTAGVVEETLLRGYSITRLARLTSSLTLGVVLSSAVFAALHFPLWGAGPTLAFFIDALASGAFFVWRRDLLAMIIA